MARSRAFNQQLLIRNLKWVFPGVDERRVELPNDRRTRAHSFYFPFANEQGGAAHTRGARVTGKKGLRISATDHCADAAARGAKNHELKHRQRETHRRKMTMRATAQSKGGNTSTRGMRMRAKATNLSLCVMNVSMSTKAAAGEWWKKRAAQWQPSVKMCDAHIAPHWSGINGKTERRERQQRSYNNVTGFLFPFSVDIELQKSIYVGLNLENIGKTL